MTSLFNRFAAVGGLLLLNGAVAFAQSEMKVDVPFTFHTATATLAPGRYVISPVNTSPTTPIYRMLNVESGKSVAVVTNVKVGRKAAAAETPQLEFKCAGEYCALAAIYSRGRAEGDGLMVRMNKAPKGTDVAKVLVPAVAY